MKPIPTDTIHVYPQEAAINMYMTGRGSVSEVVKNKRVTASYDYDPYGKMVSGAPAQERVWAYNGEEYTPQTGFIYLRARNYDPSTGTFTSKDTYLGDKTSPVTRNRYTYGNNNPVMYEDPSGHAGLLNKITSAVKSAASSVAKTVTKAATTVTNTVKSVANTVSTAVKSAVNTVTTTVKKAATTVVNTVKSAATTVKNTATAVVNKVTSTAKTVVNNVKSTVSNAVSTVKNTVSNVYNNVSNAYSSVVNDYGSIGNFAVSEVSNAYVAVKNCVVNVGSKAEVKVDNLWSDTREYAKAVYDEALQGFTSVAAKVQEVNQWWKRKESESINTKDDFNEPIKEMKNVGVAYAYNATYELINTFADIYKEWALSYMQDRIDKPAFDYSDYNPADYPDYTEMIDEWMYGKEAEFQRIVDESFPDPIDGNPCVDLITPTVWFYNQVKDGGPMDIKRKDSWDKAFPGYDAEIFVYRGEVVDRGMMGNITYGYVGSVIFSEEILDVGGGLVETKNRDKTGEGLVGIIKAGYAVFLPNHGEAPEDIVDIGKGVKMYEERYK